MAKSWIVFKFAACRLFNGMISMFRHRLADANEMYYLQFAVTWWCVRNGIGNESFFTINNDLFFFSFCFVVSFLHLFGWMFNILKQGMLLHVTFNWLFMVFDSTHNGYLLGSAWSRRFGLVRIDIFLSKKHISFCWHRTYHVYNSRLHFIIQQIFFSFVFWLFAKRTTERVNWDRERETNKNDRKKIAAVFVFCFNICNINPLTQLIQCNELHFAIYYYYLKFEMLNAMQTFLAERGSHIYENVFERCLSLHLTLNIPLYIAKLWKRCWKMIRKETRGICQIIWLLLLLHIHQRETERCSNEGWRRLNHK